MALATAAARAAGRRLRVGLIGHGTIGTYVARKLLDGQTLPRAQLSAVLEIPARPTPPELSGANGLMYTNDPEAFFGADWDVAVEAAGQPSVRAYAKRCLEQRRTFLMTSTGALCDSAFHEELRGVAAAHNSQLIVAAGALPGMDWLSSAAFESISEAVITQTKKPAGWAGTPAEEVLKNLEALTEPTVVYEGTAREAATSFPKNANSAAAFALATVGLDEAKVRLVADPSVAGPKTNISLKGVAGELSIEVKGRPAWGSQRTSLIAPLSVVKALRNLSAPEFLGV